MQKQHFFANGKLLISGEYLVLKGALALAIPLKFGQDLHIETKENTENPVLYWKSYENESLWFELMLALPTFELLESSDHLIAEKLINILKITHKDNPAFIGKRQSYLASSHLNFNRNWGLGSSSTLLNNIANWAGINPYNLLNESFGGSGYDIACASADKPIFFSLSQKKPKIESVDFRPSFQENLYFIYLGKKQSSAESIRQFETQTKMTDSNISDISNISSLMAKTDDLVKFQNLMLRHEEIISEVLNQKRIKEEQFPNFSGEIKSLGAWGGDFIMAATDQNYEYVKSYFNDKGLDVVFKYNEIALGY